ncbi:MAG: hypothetical protein K2K98_10395, partial [Muribaculaceae bacterium]|nr:hypothetical protein [Muribaculaceae bacterium]
VMSVFNFETFGAGHIPPFGFKAHPRQSILSDDIEDVDYVDVSDPQPEPKAKRSYDMKARAAEVMAYAEKTVHELNNNNDPFMRLVLLTLIAFGAEWSDENPESEFKTSMDRSKAFYDDVDKHNEKFERLEGNPNPHIALLALMTASLGFKWATDNPPKYY